MPDVVRNQPFHVSADHTGDDATRYDLKIDGNVEASLPVDALQNGVVTFSNVVVTQAGNHSVSVTAVGASGSAESDPLPFVAVAGVPGKPTNVRLTIV
jgi:hypothetical protein